MITLHIFTLTIESVTMNFRCIVHMLLKTVCGIQCLNFKLSIFTQGFYVASSSSSKLCRGPLIGVMFFGREITQKSKVYTYWRIVCHFVITFFIHEFVYSYRPNHGSGCWSPASRDRAMVRSSKARTVFTVDRITLGQFSLRVLRVYLVSVIPSMFLLSFITTSIQP